MCARLGLITGRGLTGVLREHYPRWMLWATCTLLLVANTVNIAADLGGMGSAFELVTGISSIWFHCVAAVLVVALLAWTSYRAMARVFKWLTLTLLAYVAAAWLSHPQWGAVLRATLVPTLAWDRAYLITLVAIFGTTISPYLFVWQASQEVEETRSHARGAPSARAGSLAENLAASRRDIVAGMFFSNLIAFFIMLTTGATLFATGARDVPTAAAAAAALRPLAGDGAALLFAMGVVATGVLGVPVLAGASAYAVAEAGGWHWGMDARPRQAKSFYGIIAVGLLVGMLLDHAGLDGFRSLFWAAVLNGVLAPPLIVLILIVSNDRRALGDWTNGWTLNLLGGLTALVMLLAAAGLLIT